MLAISVPLFQRGFKLREKLAHSYIGQPLPSSLYLLPDTPQIKGLHTFIRNKETYRDEFIFYSKRLIRLVIEYALSLLPFEVNTNVLNVVLYYFSLQTFFFYFIIKWAKTFTLILL